jgi:acetyl-CoA C-acetyltransferase
MKEAVIVSAARTPIGRAFRGAFNNLESPSMSSHAIKAAIDRAVSIRQRSTIVF